MNLTAVEDALTDAIQHWMDEPGDDWKYEWGNAQGIARALAILRSTTFRTEWSGGLDRYGNRVVVGEGRPPAR